MDDSADTAPCPRPSPGRTPAAPVPRPGAIRLGGVPVVPVEARTGMLLVVSRDRFPTSTDRWYVSQATVLVDDQEGLREAIGAGDLDDAAVEAMVRLDRTLPLGSADEQAEHFVSTLERALRRAAGRSLAVRVSEPRWAAVLREYQWLFPSLHVLPGHDPLMARLTAACMRVQVRERRRVIEAVNASREWSSFSTRAGRGHVAALRTGRPGGVHAAGPGGDRLLDDRPIADPVGEAHPCPDPEGERAPADPARAADANRPADPARPAGRADLPGATGPADATLEIASDGAHNPHRGASWGYFSSQGAFRLGVCGGPVLLAELHAMHMALLDHPAGPLVVWSDSRRALALVEAAVRSGTGAGPCDLQLARRVHGVADLVLERREAGHEVSLRWVRAHTTRLSSRAAVLNDAADRLAKLALRRWCTPGLSEGVEDVALSIAREAVENLRAVTRADRSS